MIRPQSSSPSPRRGVTLPEVLVVVVIVVVLVLLVAMLLPAGRERARTLACRQNLGRIGRGILLYQNALGHLPTVPKAGEGGKAPLSAILMEFGLGSMAALDAKEPPPRTPGPPPSPRTIPEFLCPSDPWTVQAKHPAPVSYRACAGSTTSGVDGVFAPGRIVSLQDVQAGDGAEYTAAFAERLVGDGRAHASPCNYAIVPGPVVPGGQVEPPPNSWRGDAGSNWSVPGWTSTLYNHAVPPNAPRSAIAEDGETASMGASSSHPGMVHVLTLDGGVRPIRPGIAPAVWEALATPTSTPEAEAVVEEAP